MFFILSKTLYFLILPTTQIVGAFALSILWKRYRRPFFWLGFGLLLLFTNIFIGNLLVSAWEVSPAPISSLGNYEVGVVLGGIAFDREPEDRVHVTGDANRILQAIQLYREGKIRKILLSSGSAQLIEKKKPEAFLLKKILVNAQIPEDDILIEARSRNTHENAVYSQELLSEQKIQSPVLLITSAYHMRRAQACFAKVGLDVDAFSVGMRSSPLQFTPDWLIIPNAGAIGQFELVFREMAGMAAYWVAGYI